MKKVNDKINGGIFERGGKICPFLIIMFGEHKNYADQDHVQGQAIGQPEADEGDNSHRPPNAFILYSQAMRSQAREENPALTNTEISRLLGKMWKEVPSEVKLQYKQKAASLQEQFKREHPDYTYRKARRKRALNELLSKNTSSNQGYYQQPGYPDGQMNIYSPQFPSQMGPLNNQMQYYGMPPPPQLTQGYPGIYPYPVYTNASDSGPVMQPGYPANAPVDQAAGFTMHNFGK